MLGAFGSPGGTAGGPIECDGQAGGAVGRIVLRGVVTQNRIVTPPNAIVAR